MNKSGAANQQKARKERKQIQQNDSNSIDEEEF